MMIIICLHTNNTNQRRYKLKFYILRFVTNLKLFGKYLF